MPLLMMWLYFSVFVFLLGAETAAAVRRRNEPGAAADGSNEGLDNPIRKAAATSSDWLATGRASGDVAVHANVPCPHFAKALYIAAREIPDRFKKRGVIQTAVWRTVVTRDGILDQLFALVERSGVQTPCMSGPGHPIDMERGHDLPQAEGSRTRLLRRGYIVGQLRGIGR